jgi:hypothetical protein
MIIILLVFVILCIIVYIFFIQPTNTEIEPVKVIEVIKNTIKQEVQVEEKIEKQIFKPKDEYEIKLFRLPKLVLNKNNKNNPTAINPTECDKNMVMDYDEVNLNSIKTNRYEKLDNNTIQKLFSINQEDFIDSEEPNKVKLNYVTTYINLPGYKAYNIQDINKFELKENNNGLVNYVKLKENESFKPYNSLIIR